MDLRTGKLLPSYKKALYDELIENITSNTSHYYAFAGISNGESTANDDYTSVFNTSWKMLFGKELANTNIVPIIKNNTWKANTVYAKYDNTYANLHSDGNYFVISAPAIVGEPYLVYKCIDNANGSPSQIKPILVQDKTFTTQPDNYKWRYIASISYNDYQNLSTRNYAPIYSNSAIQETSAINSGVEVVMVANGGSGYSAYTNGKVQTITGHTTYAIIQLDLLNASSENNSYTNSSILIYTPSLNETQIFGITQYVSNNSGKWVYTDSLPNLSYINPLESTYSIAPKVIFQTDGDSDPVAYCSINSVTNSIHSVTMLDNGSGITWANVSLQCNTNFGSGANLYAIVPPLGGHGSNPPVELDMKGMSINFQFANNESSNVATQDISYDIIGIVKNPYNLNSVTSPSYSFTKGSLYGNTAFSQVTVANVSITFSVDEEVRGATSGAVGKVVFANSSQVYIIGDKYFRDETLIAANGSTTFMTVNAYPAVYSKDLYPLYVQNINTIQRPLSNNQTESFNLLIQF
jgi:hypothetical protein